MGFNSAIEGLNKKMIRDDVLTDRLLDLLED
jgi:hypothetical protein